MRAGRHLARQFLDADPLVGREFHLGLQHAVGPENAQPFDLGLIAQSGVDSQRRHGHRPRRHAHHVLLNGTAGLDLDAGADGRTVRPRLVVPRAHAHQIDLDPMAAGGHVLDEQGGLACRGQQDVALAAAVEIGRHATGVARETDGAQQVAGIGGAGIEEAVVRPVVQQQHRPTRTVFAMGVRNQNIEVAVVVEIGELPSGPAQRAELSVKLRLFLEAEAAAVEQQMHAVLGEDQQIAAAVLVRVARGRAEHAFDVQPRRRRVEQVVLFCPVVHPGDRIAGRGKEDQVLVAVVVEVVVDDRGDGQSLPASARARRRCRRTCRRGCSDRRCWPPLWPLRPRESSHCRVERPASRGRRRCRCRTVRAMAVKPAAALIPAADWSARFPFPSFFSHWPPVAVPSHRSRCPSLSTSPRQGETPFAAIGSPGRRFPLPSLSHATTLPCGPTPVVQRSRWPSPLRSPTASPGRFTSPPSHFQGVAFVVRDFTCGEKTTRPPADVGAGSGKLSAPSAR